MKKIIVASTNPVKINAALSGFKKIFPDEQFEAEGISVESNVNDQPMTDSETLEGAANRVRNASKKSTADFWVGIEGGVQDGERGMEVFAWVVIRSADGKQGQARTGTFFLPKPIVELIKSGKELAEADNIVFGRENSKHLNGTVGALTHNVIDRTHYYTEAMVLALIPFKNPNLY